MELAPSGSPWLTKWPACHENFHHWPLVASSRIRLEMWNSQKCHLPNSQRQTENPHVLLVTFRGLRHANHQLWFWETQVYLVSPKRLRKGGPRLLTGIVNIHFCHLFKLSFQALFSVRCIHQVCASLIIVQTCQKAGAKGIMNKGLKAIHQYASSPLDPQWSSQPASLKTKGW